MLGLVVVLYRVGIVEFRFSWAFGSMPLASVFVIVTLQGSRVLMTLATLSIRSLFRCFACSIGAWRLSPAARGLRRSCEDGNQYANSTIAHVSVDCCLEKVRFASITRMSCKPHGHRHMRPHKIASIVSSSQE